MGAVGRRFASAVAAAAFFAIVLIISVVATVVECAAGVGSPHTRSALVAVAFGVLAYFVSVVTSVASRYRELRNLVREGRRVEAEFTHVVPCGAGRARVVCMYCDVEKRREYEFASDVVDAAVADAYRDGDRVPVFVDLSNPDVYVVDV